MLLTRILRQQCKDIASLLKSEEIGQPVTLKGWLKSKRIKKLTTFCHLGDGQSIKEIQIVIPKQLAKEGMTYHSCLYVEGTLVKSIGPQQNVEVLAKEVKVYQQGAPIQYDFIGDYENEYLRQAPALRIRTPEFASIFRIRSQVKMNIRKYFENEAFCRIHTPIITQNDCEGGGKIYNVNINGDPKSYTRGNENNVNAYDNPTYLTVSGQLHLESMVSNGLNKVYTFNPAFRGESSSKYHLNEFWMIESEELLGKCDQNNFNFLLDRIENFVKFILKSTLETCHEDLSFVWKFFQQEDREQLLQLAIDKPFVRITHDEAWNSLDKKSEEVLERNINKKGEIKLVEKYGNIPIFITRWPTNYKPFYSLKDPNNPDQVFAMDLLAPTTGELVGGGLREHDFNTLFENMPNNEKEKLSYYSNIRKKSKQKTGGFGLGFERLLKYLIGIENIRDTTIFHRGNKLCPC